MTLERKTPLVRKVPLKSCKITPSQRRAWNEEPSPKPRKRKNKKAGGKGPQGARRLVALRSGGICEFCRVAKATEHHHRKRRTQGGKNSEANLVHLCHDCHHVKIHGNAAWAYEVGWLVRSWQDPAEVPWPQA